MSKTIPVLIREMRKYAASQGICTACFGRHALPLRKRCSFCTDKANRAYNKWYEKNKNHVNKLKRKWRKDTGFNKRRKDGL